MRRLAALATAGVVILLLVVAQLVLPGIAAQRIRDQLSKSGRVLEVSVSAFPAIELLWHQADKVVVRMANYRSGSGKLASLLDQSADVGTLDASAAELTTGLLTVRNATLHKRGNVLTGSAGVTESDLRSAVPFLQSVTPVASSNGQLTLQGTATVLGVTATVPATVAAENGALLVRPDIPFGGALTVTIFKDPHIDVQSLSATPTATGFSVSARGRLR
jgi:hypothetical protein